MEFMVKMDKSGRLVMPKEIRDIVECSAFIVNLERTKSEDRLIFRKVPSADEMWGAFPGIDLDKHRQEHARER
ncbi:MAG: hypothetical protein ABIG96_02930 [Candidatus Micrarchaeota archaeon]